MIDSGNSENSEASRQPDKFPGESEYIEWIFGKSDKILGKTVWKRWFNDPEETYSPELAIFKLDGYIRGELAERMSLKL